MFSDTGLDYGKDILHLVTVEILSYKKSGASLGTGFWITDNKIVTCYHVIEEEVLTSTNEVKVCYRNDYIKEEGVATLKINDKNQQYDVVLLEVNQEKTTKHRILPVNFQPSYGCKFRSFGYRKSAFFKGLDSQGEIRSLCLAKQKNGYWAELLQLFSNEIDTGMSGAPILDLAEQRIVGLVASHWQTTKAVDGFLAFGIPISRVFDLYPELSQERHLVEDNLTKKKKLEKAYVPFPEFLLAPYFIRRKDDHGNDLVNEIISDFSLGKFHILTVWGSGGVGKSTLALEVAKEAFSTQFTDGVVWSTADGRTNYDVNVFLDDVLVSLKKEQMRTLDLESKFDLINLTVRDKRILFVIDNFETIMGRELINYIERIPAQFLITSRVELGVNSEKTYLLKSMKLDEAREFILREISILPNRERLSGLNTDLLAQVCGGNPMVIRWALGLLEHFFDISDVIQYLDEGEGEMSERVFGRTYNLLGSEERSILLGLALFVPSGSIELLQLLFGLKRKEVIAALNRLSSYALVERDIVNNRLWLIPLTRQLALGYLRRDRDDFTKTAGKFVSLFLQFAQAQLATKPTNFQTLKMEEKNIFASMDLAIEIGNYGAVFQFVQLLGGGLGFFDLHSSWQQAMLRLEKTLGLGSDDEYESLKSQASFEIGRGYFHIGEYKLAEQYYLKALEHFVQKEDRFNQAFVLLHLGRQQRNLGNYEEAYKYFDEGLLVARDNHDSKNEGIILNELGVMAMRQGEYDKAKEYLENSAEVKKRIGETNAYAITLYQLGNMYFMKHEDTTAKKYYSEALEIFKSVGNRRDEASCITQIAQIERRNGNLPICNELLNQSLSIFEEQGDDRGMSRLYSNLGELRIEQCKPDEAIQYFEKSLIIANRLQSPEGQGYALYGYGTYYEQKNDPASALRYFTESMQKFERIKHTMLEDVRGKIAYLQQRLDTHPN